MQVLWLASWDTEDLAFTVKTLAIYSILEPTLGVVNACPVTVKQSLTHVLGPTGLNWTRNSNSHTSKLINSNQKRRHAGNAESDLTRDFERLEDEFALHAVQIEGSPNHRYNTGHITVERDLGTQRRLHGQYDVNDQCSYAICHLRVSSATDFDLGLTLWQ